jgi:cell division protein FtsB
MPPLIRDGTSRTPGRRSVQPGTPSTATPGRRRTLQLLLVFVTLVLVINALVGERGLMETLRARRHHQELVTSIERLRAENARLRDEARRLLADPATIEGLARRELGLIKPGEVLFIIKDKSAPTAR